MQMDDETTLWRLPTVLSQTGRGRSSTYGDVSRGVMTRPIRIGPRSVGWPAGEVKAIMRARIAGRSETELRALVTELHASRMAA